MEEKSKNNTLELEKVQMEMSDYRKQVSQLEMELESLRGTNDYLERNLAGKRFCARGMTHRADKIKIYSIIVSAHTLPSTRSYT